jgi:dihydrofolate synthase / folylpolyglutamate synthase
MNYEQSLRYLEDRKFAVSKLGLERIRHLLKELGNPQKGLKVVHVTGTNGKGSVTTMVSSILSCAGYKTGTYISPHLVDFRERIAVDGGNISGEDVASLMDEIKPAADRMEGNKESGGRPTYFELATAAAFLHFRRKKVDFAVIEVGLGGRLDATNVCEDTLVAVITNVELEHTKCLGDSAALIAAEKAEIIKKGSMAVTAAAGEALAVIERKCASLSCPLKVLGKDVTYSKISSGITGTKFCVKTAKGRHELFTPMPGDHQMANAACAVAAAEFLEDAGHAIGKGAIAGGIGKAVIAGRFEVAGRSPYVILDGAHNPAGMRTARKTLESVFPEKKAIVVLSACTDKDIPAIVREIAPAAGMIIATKHSVKERTATAEAIAAEARKHCGKVVVEADVRKAVASAKDAAGKDGIVLVAGSLYLVGDVKTLMQKS